jgi:hypothetical protein
MAQIWLRLADWVKVLLVCCGVTLALAIACIVCLAFALGFFDFPPSDAKMIRNFTTHRSTFDRLIAMSDTDAQFPYIPPTLNPAVSLPRVRWQAYRSAFDTLRLHEGLARRTSGDTVTVELTVWDEGFAGIGMDKSYVFSRTPLSPLVPSLNSPNTLPSNDVYRAIAPNWYLHYVSY